MDSVSAAPENWMSRSEDRKTGPSEPRGSPSIFYRILRLYCGGSKGLHDALGANRDSDKGRTGLGQLERHNSATSPQRQPPVKWSMLRLLYVWILTPRRLTDDEVIVGNPVDRWTLQKSGPARSCSHLTRHPHQAKGAGNGHLGSVHLTPGSWIQQDVGVVEGPFVPSGFVVPLALTTERFRLEPLGPQHNDSDYEARSSSVEHIRMTPGWETSSWPDDRSLVDNLRDLQGHAADFENRTGFTYTVLDPATDDVIGCVHIYPDGNEQHDARVRSWVWSSRPELDVPLCRAVADWLADEWPFERVAYAERADGA